MSCELIQKMDKDSIYECSMFISLGNKCATACSKIEILFSENKLSVPDPSQLNPIIYGDPQLTRPDGDFLIDTTEWMNLCWLYKAKGNEKHLTIGNFNETMPEEGLYLYPNSHSAYYYIDDISIQKVSTQALGINLGDDKTVCQATISDTLTAHGSYYNGWLWSTGDTTQSIVATQPGLYWVEASNGMCHLRDTIEIIYIDTAALSLGPDIQACPQDFPFTIAGPDHMETYQWSTGSIAESLVITTPGEYVLESTHACGLFLDTVEVKMAVLPIDLGMDTVLCGQPSFQRTLAVPHGYDSYLWSNGVTTPSIEITAPGNYSVTAFSTACGLFSDTLSIVNQPLLSLDLGPDTMRCIENGYVISANTGFDQYDWNTGSNAPAIEVTNYGTYYVTASYVCGVLTDSITIFEPPLLFLQLPNDTTLNLGEEIIIVPAVTSPSSWLTYFWSPSDGLNCTGCEVPTASPTSSKSYALSVKDEFGCEVTDEVRLSIINLKRVYIPNAFSPNGDGLNDIFTVYGGPELTEVVSMKVFDRWGGLVYLAEHFPGDGSQGWDGSFKGRQLNSGIFTFSIELEYLNGEHERRMGDVQLMR